VLPFLSPPGDLPAIQELIPTIVARRSSPEVYSTVQWAVAILKLSGPLQKKLAELLARHKAGENILPLIDEVAAAFGITGRAVDVKDPNERTLLNLAKFAVLVLA
jgi:hypothetical protein